MPAKLSHDQCREKVCVVCIRKGYKTLTEDAARLVRIHVRENYNLEDPDYPCGICVTCYTNLKKEKNID